MDTVLLNEACSSGCGSFLQTFAQSMGLTIEEFTQAAAEGRAPTDAFLRIRPSVNVVYEDENLLIADKNAGMLVHSDTPGSANTLIDHIQAYLYQKKEWSPYQEGAFAPALCNRIDRNTGGIVIAAKTAEALRVIPSEEVTLELTNGLSPIVLTPVDEKEDFAYMVLPVRIKNG